MKINTEIKVLKAGFGDCIFISLKSEVGEYNILIDGGLKNTYFDARNRQNTAGPLKILINELKEHHRLINLLVLTHVDDDHVLGLKEWFEDDFPSPNFVKCFWINDDMEICIKKSLDNTSANTSSLLKLLREKGIQYCNHIVKGKELITDFCTIRVIAPSTEYHDKIARDLKALLNNAGNDFYQMTLKEHLEAKWKTGSLSSENKASIAIEIENKNGEKFLMLGDAEILDIMDGLKAIHDEKEFPINYNWVKIPHHCSRNNFDPAFLQMIHADNFIVSTDGSKFYHPDKDVLAYIVDQTSANIYFNYPERSKVVFTDQDYKDYPQLVDRIKVI